MTRICIPILINGVEKARRDAAAAVAAGADLIELRMDLMRTEADVKALIDQLNSVADIDRTIHGAVLPAVNSIPLLYTCRAEYEGGFSALEDAERFALLKHAHSLRPGLIDIELQAVLGSRASAGLDIENEANLVVSMHDFEGRPERLYNNVAELRGYGQISKIAWRARSVRDNLEAFELLTQGNGSTIALCMGEAGLASRVLAKKFGAYLTFAALDEASSTAPGQLTIAKLKNLYRHDKLTKNTRVFGVIAKPVAHSMSPAVHNAAFGETDLDAVYLPFLVEESYESFKAFVESFAGLEALHLGGLSVTVPHKGNALHYLTVKGAKIEPLAAKIGAVNTITIKREHKRVVFEGYNTDYAALLDCVTTGLGVTRAKLQGVRVAVLGAGGTGRTAVAALAHYGADVIVINRTSERAAALATEFNGKPGTVIAGTLDDLKKMPVGVIINTTTIGMTPNVDASPLGDAFLFSADMLVFDTVYNPAETKLLREAKAGGAKTVGGADMFVRQAAAQFEMWTGKPAPVDVMKAALAAGLASSN